MSQIAEITHLTTTHSAVRSFKTIAPPGALYRAESEAYMNIKEMLERTGWTVEGFGIYFDIPKRTVENWIYRGGCPDYLRALMQYKLFKENIIMNEKITFKHATNCDESKPNCGFSEEADSIIVAPPFDLGDWLDNASVHSENDGDIWYVIDESGERTGEAYMVIKREPTDEELRG